MENLGIDPKLLIAQIVNFILFFFIIKKFVSKPFTQFVSNEKSKEKEKEKLLNDLKKSEELFKLKEKEMKAKMNREMSLALNQAKKEAKNLKDDLMKQTEQEIQELKFKEKEQLEREKNLLYADIKKQVVDLSMLIVNHTLKESLDEEMKRKVTRNIIINADKTVSLKLKN